MLQEFKNFIMKGNVLDLAVGVILAGAFGAVVGSFVDDILMPIVGLLTGGVDFNDLKYVLKAAGADPAAEPEVAIKYGALIGKFITFIITAFAMFLVIKAYNRANPPAPAAPAGPSDIDLLSEIRDLLKK
jgi:large conductance mechanosensitive channel